MVFMLTGSIVNALSIVAGSLVGMLLNWLAGYLPGSDEGQMAQRLQDIVMSFLVRSLNSLVNAAMFTPCWPRAGPTGGAGVALPAGICSFT